MNFLASPTRTLRARAGAPARAIASDQGSRLQVALDTARIGDWRWDRASGNITLSARAAELLELPAEVPLSWPSVRERIHPDDRRALRREFAQSVGHHGDVDVECRTLLPDGRRCWIAIVGRGDLDADGSLHSVTGIVQDVSGRKRVESALRQSEEVLRALANSIPQLSWMANADGYVVWFNERWYDYTGKTPPEVIGWGWQSVHDPDVLPRMLQRWHACLRTGAPFEMEFPLRGADGKYRWFLARAQAVRDSDGKVLRWFGTATDVDQVKRIQQALREETNVLELLNNTGNALATQRELTALLHTATEAAAGVSGARYGAFLYHGDGGGDQVVVVGEPHPLFADPAKPEAGALFGTTLRRAETLRLDDLPHELPAVPMPTRQPPVRSFLSMPVIARSGEVLGSLFFGHPEPAIFNARTERTVRAIAAQVAVAIDNTRLNDATRHAAEERKILLENERLLRAEAERGSQIKDEFLATLSHELRTPLSAILGWAQVLRRGSRDEQDLQRGLQTIERNARVQAQLIEDLLDMSRITSGKVLLDIHSVPPAQFIEAAIETVRPAAEAKQIRISRHIAPDTPAIAGDPARLQQVTWNLLSNAIKFTPRGGAVEIGAGTVGDQVAVTVRDTGVGIRPEFLGHVFERFRQADASTTRHHGGLGLGLAIVKHLVEQHGGSVHAYSAGENQGACFTIELPRARGLPAAPRNNEAPLPQPAAPDPDGLRAHDLEGLRVLVVDDEPDARNLIERILTDCHADVVTAAGAAEALNAFRRRPPDVLISDLGMPDMDGFELLTQVRAMDRAAGGGAPAIALTAFARPDDRVRALAAGFSAHLAKPVEPAELIDTVARLSPSRPH